MQISYEFKTVIILQVAFKTDLFKLEGNTVTLNGETITLPMHKTYKDGSEVRIEDIGKLLTRMKKSYTSNHKVCKNQTLGDFMN